MRKILARAEQFGPLSVASFIYCATRRAEANSAASILTKFFDEAERSGAFEKLLSKTAPDTDIEAGMLQALDEAHDIRRRTGGNDDYVGLRYVLFAIFTAQADPLKAEVEDLFRALGQSRGAAAEAITQYCLSAMEEPENRDIWDEVIAARRVIAEATPGLDVALVNPDDPWLAGLSDRSGGALEANAFAAMICAREFLPPLAVGVFGDWGAGKSFFMRSVYDAIDRRGFVNGVAGDGADVSFIENVVQIRFNAWHYAETNLWASLIDNIFTSLDRWAQRKNNAANPLDKLSTARRLTIDAAQTLVQRRKEQSIAEQTLSDAQAALESKVAEVASQPATYVAAAWTTLVEDKMKKADVEDAVKTLELNGLVDSAANFHARIGELDRELAGFSLFRSATIRWLSLPVVVIAVTVMVIFLPPVLAWISDRLHLELSHAALALSGIAAPIVSMLGIATRRTSVAIDKVRGFRKDFDSEVRRLATLKEEARKKADADLAIARRAVDDAATGLRVAIEKVAEAEQDYNEQDGKTRMLRFVRDRVADGDYSRHLGFVALVRRDFEELSALMTLAKAPDDAKARLEAHRRQVESLISEAGDALTVDERATLESTLAEPKREEAFERIVLYIDDLDRCPPEQVVAVLQAIHLLLTFPLFVVFVAVDVRWLRHALCKQYDGQITLGDERRAIATASDYLEKIFQLPYWVRPMGVDGTRDILFDRMGREPTRSEAALEVSRGSETPNRDVAAVGSTRGHSASATMPPSGPLLKASSLRLTANERNYISSMAAALDGSPRRTLRFINLYRIIKASLPREQFQALERSEYGALATLLAISITADEAYPHLMPIFRKFGDAAFDIQPEIARLKLSQDVADRIDKALALLNVQGADPEAVRKFAPLVSRFGFLPVGVAEDAAVGRANAAP